MLYVQLSTGTLVELGATHWWNFCHVGTNNLGHCDGAVPGVDSPLLQGGPIGTASLVVQRPTRHVLFESSSSRKSFIAFTAYEPLLSGMS